MTLTTKDKAALKHLLLQELIQVIKLPHNEIGWGISCEGEAHLNKIIDDVLNKQGKPK